MRKLKLDTEAIRVESFPTVPQPKEEEGTVHGAEATARTGQCPTCGVSCYTSCRAEGLGGMFVMAGPACTCPVGTI